MNVRLASKNDRKGNFIYMYVGIKYVHVEFHYDTKKITKTCKSNRTHTSRIRRQNEFMAGLY